MKYQGSCHCGQVAFEVEGDMGDVLACNCSICQRKGSLLWFVPRTALTLTTPEDKLASYTFNKHVIQHRFCPNCGIHPFGEGAAPNGDKMAAVNVPCLEGIDIATLKVQHYNGRDI
jgi:hypothetical protein